MNEQPIIYSDPNIYQTQSVEMNPLVLIVYLVAIAITVASLWKIFTKAGKPGWAAIIPFYNLIVFLQIVGRPVWWFVLLLIPLVNIVVGIVVLHDLSKVFGKGVGMTLLNIFLPVVGYPMLAWGNATYTAPGGASVPPSHTAPAMDPSVTVLSSASVFGPTVATSPTEPTPSSDSTPPSNSTPPTTNVV